MKKDETQKLIDKLNKLQSKAFNKESYDRWDLSTYNKGLKILCDAIDYFNRGLEKHYYGAIGDRQFEIGVLKYMTDIKNDAMDCIAKGIFIGHKKYVKNADRLILVAVAQINDLYNKVKEKLCGDKSINEAIAEKQYEIMKLEQEGMELDFSRFENLENYYGSLKAFDFLRGHAYQSKKILEEINACYNNETQSQFLKELKKQAIKLNKEIADETEQKCATLTGKKVQKEEKPIVLVKLNDTANYENNEETEND